jgi:hypothetical protein
MRLPLVLIAILTASPFLSGCVGNSADIAVRRLNHEAEASGSPYRWRNQRIPGGWTTEKYRVVPPAPGPIPADLQPTAADVKLQKDILAMIDGIQRDWGSSVAPSLLGVKPLSASDGSVRELWFIKLGDGAARYEITMIQDPQGGTHFEGNGPLD